MQLRDIFIALIIIFLWSINLVIQKIFSQQIPLEFFNLLRFLYCIPLVFILKKPSLNFFKLLNVSFFWNVLTFFLVGLGLEYGASVGSISVIYQLCSFFGVFFCFLLLKEIPKVNQIAGMVLSFSGVVLLFSDKLNHAAQTAELIGMMFILFAAMSWGIGVTLIKKYNLSCDLQTNVWITSVASIPMIAMIFIRGGFETFETSLNAVSSDILLGAFYASYIANLLGGCLWFWLLKRYPGSLITPFMLLLPLFSCLISYFFLEERFTVLQIVAFVIIVLGVSINQNVLKNLGFTNFIRRILWKKSISTS